MAFKFLEGTSQRLISSMLSVRQHAGAMEALLRRKGTKADWKPPCKLKGMLWGMRIILPTKGIGVTTTPRAEVLLKDPMRTPHQLLLSQHTALNNRATLTDLLSLRVHPLGLLLTGWILQWKPLDIELQGRFICWGQALWQGLLISRSARTRFWSQGLYRQWVDKRYTRWKWSQITRTDSSVT